MIDWVYYLTNLLFFDILLLYYQINLKSPIIFCLSTGNIYLSACIYLSCSFFTVSKLFCGDVFEAFVVL